MDEPPDTPDLDELELSRRDAAVAQAIKELSAYFDSIVFLATFRTEAGNTASFTKCDGNYMAQTGLVHTFLEKRRAVAARDALTDEDD